MSLRRPGSRPRNILLFAAARMRFETRSTVILDLPGGFGGLRPMGSAALDPSSATPPAALGRF